MASTIKVNNIQNQCGANIVNKCGTTITLGASGDTITLACGASQTGFGRTGTVDWDTTAKTASFTAVSGNGYFVNTTSGAVTMTLPASPSAGDIVAVSDYANTFATNNLTVARNGSLINGQAFDYENSTNGISLTFVYVDGTRGWKNVNDGTTNATGQSNFIIATGGTITTCGDYKIHTFTGPGTFTVTNAGIGTPCAPDSVDYLTVAGGGGGGGYGGGGGAGGTRASATTYCNAGPSSPRTACVSALPVSVTAYPITVGSGGAGSTIPTYACGVSGSNSVFSTITSAGGGGGGRYGQPNGSPGIPGGSGGGGGNGEGGGGGAGGTGNTPPVSPPQGSPGGQSTGTQLSPYPGTGGGGGLIAAGTDGGSGGGGNGGAGGGFPNAFGTSGENCGSYYYFGGGAGGKGTAPGPGTNQGSGGLGGGGDGQTPTTSSTAGTANTGGGGGGGMTTASSGGSGIVIIRYKYQ